MKLLVKFTSSFKRDLKKANKQNKNLQKLFDIIEKIANKEKLELQYHDHFLGGDFKLFRECHIEPDWLLVYLIDENYLVLTLLRTGSHSEIFN